MTGASSRRSSLLPAVAACAAVAVLLALGLIAAGPVRAEDGPGFAYSVPIGDEINQRSALELDLALDDAKRKAAAVVIIRLDTPGGLGTSMRRMIKQIVAAPMPVIVYVHPPGGRAASAGMFLTIAGDVAAMAPATNIGSATGILPDAPTGGDPELERYLRDIRRQVMEDGIALARKLARERGRNAELAERMVRVATNVSATRALREDLIDVVAPGERALLRKLDGLRIKGPKAQTLRTAGLEIRRVDPSSIKPADEEDPDESSLARSLAYVFVPVAVLLALWFAYRRTRAGWRRARRRRRLRKLRHKRGDAEVR